MSYAPLVLFAFNRPDLLESCVASLLANEEAASSNLYVFVDGPRTEKAGENGLVASVREYVKTISGFKSVHYQFSEEHKGLAPSVIEGVSTVMEMFGKAIVMEDDLTVSGNFLAFMNAGLEKYRNDRRVFSIGGYTNKVSRPAGYVYDAYFCPRNNSWGWATWKDRWDSVDWDLSDWPAQKKNARTFNRWGGSDLWKMLNDWHEGRNSSWSIRFCYAQFLQQGLSLYPMVSKVGNDGFDGRGTHGKKWSRFKYSLDGSSDKGFLFPEDLAPDKRLFKQAMSYHSVLARIWSRIMYLIL